MRNTQYHIDTQKALKFYYDYQQLTDRAKYIIEGLIIGDEEKKQHAIAKIKKLARSISEESREKGLTQEILDDIFQGD